MTPVYKINLDGSNPSIDSGQVWAKMENQNPTGTHKDRSMARWISHYVQQGIEEFAISSSGNSAISAGKYCDENNIKLYVFVSPFIDKEKIERLKAYRSVDLTITKTPVKDVFQFCRRLEIPNLRASTDDNATVGYKDIALELMEQLPHIDNIFIPTSSGATLEGMYNGYVKSQKIPAFYAVQTTKIHPIASYFDKDFVEAKTSYARAIVDNVAHRRDLIIKIIQETGGGGFVISNRELEEAREGLKNLDIMGSDPDSLRFGWHSALSFAGFFKWQKQNPKNVANKISVCLFTD